MLGKLKYWLWWKPKFYFVWKPARDKRVKAMRELEKDFQKEKYHELVKVLSKKYNRSDKQTLMLLHFCGYEKFRYHDMEMALRSNSAVPSTMLAAHKVLAAYDYLRYRK